MRVGSRALHTHRLRADDVVATVVERVNARDVHSFGAQLARRQLSEDENSTDERLVGVLMNSCSMKDEYSSVHL